jgi:hypothetical protein
MDDRSFAIIIGGCFGVASVLISSSVSFLIARRTARGNTEKNLIDYYTRRITGLEKAKERLTSGIDRAKQDTSSIESDVERAMSFVNGIFDSAGQVLADISHCIPLDAEKTLNNMQSQVRSSLVRRSFLDKGLAKLDTAFGKNFEGDWLNDWTDILEGMERFVKILRSELDRELRSSSTNIEALVCTILPKSGKDARL